LIDSREIRKDGTAVGKALETAASTKDLTRQATSLNNLMEGFKINNQDTIDTVLIEDRRKVRPMRIS
jgi:hypothetical protein